MSRNFSKIINLHRSLRLVAPGCTRNHYPTRNFSAKIPSSVSFGDLGSKILVAAKISIDKEDNDILDEPSIEEFVDKGIALLVQRLPPGYRLSPNVSYNMATALNQSNKLNRNHWLRLLINRPGVFEVNAEKFQNVIFFVEKLLYGYEVTKGTTFKLVTSLPESFFIGQGETQAELENIWNSFFFTWFGFCRRYEIEIEEGLMLIITTPEIVLYDTIELFDQVNNLRAEYFHDKKVLRELILTAGSAILFEPWDELSQKLDLLIKDMFVDIKTLSKYGFVLNESVANIRVRFLFLDRAGLYQRPSPKGLGTSISASPPINQIVEPNDEDFVLKTVGHGLTLEEFLAFRDTIMSEDESFRCNREKVWFSEVGYDDKEFKEDLDEELKFAENYIKPVKRPTLKPK